MPFLNPHITRYYDPLYKLNNQGFDQQHETLQANRKPNENENRFEAHLVRPDVCEMHGMCHEMTPESDLCKDAPMTDTMGRTVSLSTCSQMLNGAGLFTYKTG